MKMFFLFGIVLFSFGKAYSQKEGTANKQNPVTYTFSYFGNNLIYPGIKAGADIVLTEKTVMKSKTKKNAETVDQSITKQLLTGADIGFFWQPESHIGVFNYYELIFRKIRLKNNKYSLVGIAPGVYRSFYPETYDVDKKGNVKKTALGGRFYFAPVLILGTGRLKKDNFLHSLTFATDLMFLFDYNSGIVPLLNLEVGFCFDFKRKTDKN